MPLTTLRRYLTVGVLAAGLTLAGASPANARDLGPAGHAWLWLQNVWTQGISVLWTWHGGGTPSSGSITTKQKQGPGLDPNGAASSQSNSTSPVCETCGDQGPGLDPNG